MRYRRSSLVVPSLVVAAVGQAPILRQLHCLLPPESNATHIAASCIGDVDGDGSDDILFLGDGVLAGYVRNVVWRGTADGGMAELPGALPQLLRRAAEARLADFDLDGDLDCVVVNAPVSTTPCTAPYGTGVVSDLLWNDGTGHFTLGATPLPAPGQPNYTCVAVGDVDGDGDPDIVAGATPYLCVPNPQQPWQYTPSLGENHLYLNNGTGTFTLGVGSLPPHADPTNDVVLADFDGDGDLDLFAGNSTLSGSTHSRVYSNNGTGVFTELIGALPLQTLVHPRGIAHPYDFDGDGDIDILLHVSNSFSSNLRYLRNTGGGVFADATAALPSIATAAQVAVGDWNGDGDPDFAVRGTPTVVVFNQAGTFTISQTRPAFGPMFALDLETDGDLDLIGLGGRYLVERNDGTGHFHSVANDLPSSWNLVRALVDIDGDGDLDGLATRAGVAAPAYVLANEGNGRFAVQPNGQFSTDPVEFSPVLVGDVDGDGDPDVLGISSVGSPLNGHCRLYRNVAGILVSAPFPPLAARCGAFGDLDGDGDLDLYLGQAGSTDQVLRNDGTGTFTTVTGAVSSSSLPEDLALADFDGDGDLDVALASWLYPNKILRNLGNGTFVDGSFPTSTGTLVCTADFDGDADKDLVFGNYGGSVDRLYRNDGLGNFTDDLTAFPPPSLASRLMRVGDVDGDGDVDIVRAISTYLIAPGDNRLELLRNDGTGHFSPGSLRDVGAWWAELGDLDGDGDADVLLSQDELRVHTNLMHQVTWRTLPRVGRPFVLDLYGIANEPYILGMSLIPANLPIPGMGRLRLDPASLLVMQFGTYDAAGRAAFIAAVPLIPSLTGLDLHWQALYGVVLRLGNLETTTLGVY